TTYYWAIDEVGAAPDNTTYAGEVWSFTTMPAIQTSDDPNLIGWWKFDEGAGRTVLDWSGHGNHGAILGNPAWVAGTGDDADAFALDFDGFGDYVDCGIPAVLDTIEQITVAAWIRVDVFEQTDQAIVSKGQNVWRLVRNGLTSNELRFDCGGQAIGSTNVNDGEWHHAVGMSDGATASLYVDGALDALNASAGAVPIDPNLTLWIADTNRPGEGPQAWNGLIDDVRIYNRALTLEEIELIMRGNPLLAWDPKPVYGSTVDYLNVYPLTWSPGENAVQHDVYLGLDRLAVADADTSTADIYQGRQDANSFDGSPETLILNQDYYWRIDEINSDETITKGSVWRFTVPDYLLVEDFEAYNDLNEDEAGSNRIYLAWSDGYANPTVNGSTIGYPEPDFVNGEHFVETDIVNSGSQSGPLLYNNTTASYSEVTISTDLLIIGPDWTVGETETLALWIYGDPNNSATEQMYVKIDDAKISINPDLTLADWQEVTIDLDDVNTDLSNVTTFGIGIERTGATGGEGMVFIDDIRLNLLLQQ
ncbi:MAG: LamG domain-containing protein, partial [Phycisphaerales bacterium]